MGDTMEVRCGKCEKHFDIPLSNVKSTSITIVYLNNKHLCPHCNKWREKVFNPNVDVEKVMAERAEQYEAEQARKAAEPVSCPQCKSQQFTVDRGFSIGKAILGNLAFGDIGSIAGVKSGKVRCICLKCGTKWKVGS